MDTQVTQVPQVVQDVQEITVDISELTFGDMETILNWSGNNLDMIKLIPLLERIVVGGVRDKKIMRDLPRIMNAITAAMTSTANPAGPDGSDPLH